MIVPLYLILLMFVVHYVFDWVLQTRWMAENKSKNNNALLLHVGIYSIGLFLLAAFTPLSIFWACINTVAHFAVDFISSRITSHMWTNNMNDGFWNTIGADQMVHYLILFSTIAA